MGCRAAAALARQLSDESDEAVLLGVICLSFPLHPPGQTHGHRQRGDDLRALPRRLSVLFVSGTEDTMCDRVRTGRSNAETFQCPNEVAILCLFSKCGWMEADGLSCSLHYFDYHLQILLFIPNMISPV